MNRAALFKIKICGLTRIEDVAAVAAGGADAIGLNFYAKSQRFVSDDLAARLTAPCRGRLQIVGVFVNETVEDIRTRAERLKLDWIQLHGDEPPEMIAELNSVTNVLRAFRYGERGLAPVSEYLEQCRQIDAEPAAVLLDAAAAGQYGGTGRTIDWSQLHSEIARVAWRLPWVLAGGLKPANVRAAVTQLRPHAVDTASGVESAPGVKAADQIQAFVHAAKQGWRG